MFESIKDKVVLVTGASRGIGKAIALKFGQFGAKVAVNYASSEAEAKEVVEAIKKLGTDAEAYKCNVSSREEVTKMFDDIEARFGSSVDILINNAGITKDALMLRMTDEAFDKVIDINLKGTFICCQVAFKGMAKKRYGKIVNISSIVGFTGNPGQANYTASKAGVVGMSKTLAAEFAARGVRVNVVAPGFIESDMTSHLPEEVKASFLANIPLKAMGNPDDVANGVIYLSSAESDYITGETLHINGGLFRS